MAKHSLTHLRQLEAESIHIMREVAAEAENPYLALIEAVSAALAADLGKPEAETRLTEILPVQAEIRHALRHLKRWMRPRSVTPNWNFLPGRAQLYPQPRGMVGVIGAWNYPLLLNLSPAVNAIAAGNRVMIKPSEHAPATAALVQRLQRP